jgi:hypothetical protein
MYSIRSRLLDQVPQQGIGRKGWKQSGETGEDAGGRGNARRLNVIL